jgi:hypothetical protein
MNKYELIEKEMEDPEYRLVTVAGFDLTLRQIIIKYAKREPMPMVFIGDTMLVAWKQDREEMVDDDSSEELTPSPTLDYDSIPEHIKKKAMEISNYFQEQGLKKWKLMGIQSRDFSDEQYYKLDSSRKIQ